MEHGSLHDGEGQVAGPASVGVLQAPETFELQSQCQQKVSNWPGGRGFKQFEKSKVSFRQ